jgi:hypothetical protein
MLFYTLYILWRSRRLCHLRVDSLLIQVDATMYVVYLKHTTNVRGMQQVHGSFRIQMEHSTQKYKKIKCKNLRHVILKIYKLQYALFLPNQTLFCTDKEEPGGTEAGKVQEE